MSLLLGSKVPYNVSFVFEKFKLGALRRASEFYGESIQKYHPILSSSLNYKIFSIEDLKKITETSSMLDFSEEFLRIRSELYTNLHYLQSADGGESRQFYIEPNLKTKHQGVEREYHNALKLMKEACPWMGETFDKIIYELCPMSMGENFRSNFGISSQFLLGLIFVSPVESTQPHLQLALNIAHELGHNILMIYQTGSKPIIGEDFYKPVYSGIRKKERIGIKSLHAAVALGFMLSLSRGFIDNSRLSSAETFFVSNLIKEYEDSLESGLDAIKPLELSDLGSQVFKELSKLLD